MSPVLRPAELFLPFQPGDLRRSIPERFEGQVARHPDRVAVRVGEADLTYRELGREADRIARGLVARLGPHPARVASLLDRDAGLVAGALGVLKARKIWVPLDVGYPAARNSYLVRDSRASLLLTDAAHAPAARELAGSRVPVLTLEELAEGGAGPDPERRVPPGAAACLLYTSGSTGLPKGVVYDHRTLLHFIMRYTNALRIGADDRLAQLASFSHIAGVSDSLRGLLNGAAVLPLDSKKHAASEIIRWLEAEEISILHLVPSVLRHLAGAMTGAESFPRLRLIHSGGDTLTPRDVELYRRHFPPTCILLNNLGCTEVSSFCHYLIGHDTDTGRDSVPVGYPVQDTEVLLLDEEGVEVPEGEVGEIGVKSRYLAVGYWRDRSRTKRAFLRAPRERGVRIYRTGDLGRRLPDGRLLHLGRSDFQVQIRGFRVEAGEVERALLRSDAIVACAVVGATDPLGETQLVAYAVAAPGRAPLSVQQLRALLRDQLPSYMVPAIYVWLDRLPTTPNGKLDRLALPPPDWQGARHDRPYVEPRTENERSLARIWAEVLGVSRVSADDSFFELGGDSLRIMQVIGRVGDAHGVDLPVEVSFDQPTLGDLARWLEAAEEGGVRRAKRLPPLPRAEEDGPAPLSYAQRRMWFFNQVEPDSPLYNLAVGGPGVSSRPRAGRWLGRLDLPALRQSLEEIVRRHEVLRSIFPLRDGEVVQEVGTAAAFHLPVEDISGVPADQREAVAHGAVLAETRRPFDLTREPPMRALVLRLAPDDHILLLVVHHIAFDRWSRWVLLRELVTLYRAYSEGIPSSLPPLPIQYRDYAVWQQANLGSERLATSLSFWKTHLEGAPALLELPTDRPRPAHRSHSGGLYSLPLADTLQDRLEAFARAERATLPMVLVAALSALLSRWSGQRDLSIGVIVAGRNWADVENLIGCFANTLVLRTDISGDPSFRGLLRRVREELVAAYVHEEVPFERLVEDLRPERNTGYHPLFQVLFNHLVLPGVEVDLPGVQLQDFEVSVATAHVDLSLDVEALPAGMACYFGYSADLFDAKTVGCLAEQYRELLQAAVLDPDLPLSALRLRHASAEGGIAARLLDQLGAISEEEAQRLLGEIQSGSRSSS